ncbi:D-2-hydroxyacid dehydrogenase family protein [Alicyclobacillus ferrooxydans]|uniref:2-hydroxyacid dehydrogenase n=1 Tax=Alicyclobacillus ferrooxydans TaxID=471514 RepID=A0A0P9CLP1_9BACL|nr:D-2-hydroxyacid dehydrogenase family protein [Alicyclobacillus ferrooxydans]KPV43922.1 2-hydroxyacid dehydrogenase [Alicyclobacillus ferrooxydans]
MKLQCIVLDDYQGVALSMADWSKVEDQVDVEVLREHISDEDSLVQAIEQADIIVMMRERTPIQAPLLRRLPNLKLLITTGMRNASLDAAAAVTQGIIVCGTEGNSQAASELTWALILGLAKGIAVEHEAFQKSGPWQSTVGADLYGHTLGIIGLGRLGSQVARVGLAFGMDVLAWSQNLTADLAAKVGVRMAASKEELLTKSDFVSIHLVQSERTRGLIGERELQMMQPNAFLINTSRSAIVNQEALVHALQQKWIQGAGLDVFDEEPLPLHHPLRSLPNVLATPHIGYVTEDTYRTWFAQIIENIQGFLAGSPIRQLTF